MRVDARADQPFAPLASYLDVFGGRVLIGADSPGRREVLHEMLQARASRQKWFLVGKNSAKSSARLALTIAPDVQGLTLTSLPVAVISETLFGARVRQERRRKRAGRSGSDSSRPAESSPGAPVVHSEYGVGRYVGLQPMEVAGQNGEFLVLEYQDGDRVYVPVQPLHLVTRHTRLGARKRSASQARHRISGPGGASARPSRSATSQLNCWISTHAAKRRKA